MLLRIVLLITLVVVHAQFWQEKEINKHEKNRKKWDVTIDKKAILCCNAEGKRREKKAQRNGETVKL